MNGTPRIAVQFADTSNRARILGLSILERNRRAAARAGLVIISDPDEQALREQGLTHLLSADDRWVAQPSFFKTLGSKPAGWEVSNWQLHSLDATDSKATLLSAQDDLLPVASKADIRAAEASLLRSTQKVTDGPISRTINRPISRFFSLYFLRLGMKPIHASAICLAVGIACAVMAAQPGWLALAITGLLFQFASIFDGVDGEMARVTFSESQQGAAIDTSVDNFTYFASLAGFFIGWWREEPPDAAFYLLGGTLLVLAVVASLCVRFMRRHAKDASMVIISTSVHHAAASSRSLGLKAASFMFPIARRDVAALVVMVLTLAGSRMMILGAVLFGLLLGLYALTVHARALAQSAEALRAG
jgi:CDP-L-myo-inositol myo-inositolphosphotransferase